MYALRFSPATLRPSSAFLSRTPASLTRRSSALTVRMSAASAAAADAADAYARALSGVASSAKILESTLADLEKLEKIFKDPSVPQFFSNQIVSLDLKHELIEEIVKASDFQPQTSNFLRVLVDNDRAEILPEIVQEFVRYYNELTSTEVAVVSSVVRLESEDLAQIAQEVQKITGAKNVRLKTETDEALVGGFTIRYGPGGSKFIDMSLHKQLDEIASTLELPDAAPIAQSLQTEAETVSATAAA